MANENAWHRGDRVFHRPSGQRGVVEGWKGNQLCICWGLQQVAQGYIRSWVNDEDCAWEPAPMDVLDKKGNVLARMEQEIVLPPENKPEPVWVNPSEIVVDRKGGADLSKYPLP